MILFTNETAKDSTLTANSTDVNYPLSNLVDSRLTRLFSTSSNTTAEIVFNAGSAITVNCVAIANHNITSGATIKLQGNASDSWSSPSVNETLTYDSDIIMKTFTGGSYRYWRIQIVDASNPDGYIELGRAWIGEYYTVPGIGKSISDTRKSYSQKSITVSGQSYLDKRYFGSLISVKIPKITHTEKAEIITEFERVDIGIPFFVKFDETCIDLSKMYVTMDTDQMAFNLLGNTKYYEAAISLVEEVK